MTVPGESWVVSWVIAGGLLRPCWDILGPPWDHAWTGETQRQGVTEEDLGLSCHAWTVDWGDTGTILKPSQADPWAILSNLGPYWGSGTAG
jgi:hypothetical protein